MKRINIGILGCAAIAQRSMLPAIKLLANDYNLIAVASRNKSKARELSKAFDCEAITGYNNLLKRTDIEAVYLPLPTGIQKEWISKSLRAGKHVYAEKSIAMNLNDANEIVEDASKFNLGLMEGYMFQYHSQHQFIKKLLSENKIGTIRHFSSTFCFPPLDKDNFRYDPIIGGGVIFDAAGYTVRSAFYFLGSDLTVEAATVYFDPVLKSSIYGSAFMSDKNGVGASLAFGFDNFYQCNYVLLGSKGKITATKAFTPRSNERPLIIVESVNEKLEVTMKPDNHFVNSLLEFKKVILGHEREKHFSEILEQSAALTKIFELATFKS